MSLVSTPGDDVQPAAMDNDDDTVSFPAPSSANHHGSVKENAHYAGDGTSEVTEEKDAVTSHGNRSSRLIPQDRDCLQVPTTEPLCHTLSSAESTDIVKLVADNAAATQGHLVSPKPDHDATLLQSSLGDEILHVTRYRTDSDDVQYDVRTDKDTGQSKAEPIQKPRAPIFDMSVNHNTVLAIVQLLRRVKDAGLPDDVNSMVERSVHNLRTQQVVRHVSSADLEADVRASKQRRRTQQQAQAEYQLMHKERMKLPINRVDVRQRILTALRTHNVLLVVSATGSGKTTQLPQLILENNLSDGLLEPCNILCTQPRRLAAITVAKRVADEQAVKLTSSVGYSVRFEQRGPIEEHSISYWTAGVLLKSLHEDPDRLFSKFNVIIIDEIHERDITTDVCLATLRDLVFTYKQKGLRFPKIILMSATVDAVKFEKYFADDIGEGIEPLSVSTIEVSGRNYGVDVHMLEDFLPMVAENIRVGSGASRILAECRKYLEKEEEFSQAWNSCLESDWTSSGDAALTTTSASVRLPAPLSEDRIPYGLFVLTIAHLLRTYDSGDILVFLPGLAEIDEIKKRLLEQSEWLAFEFNNPAKIRIFRLHSSLHETNREAFDEVPRGCRRLILATNIAQTSITLPDVVHVIDCGTQRLLRYNSTTRVSTLKSDWLDKSASFQRRGRAGRTRPGHYWAMFTQERYDSLPEQMIPEIRLNDITMPTLIAAGYLGDASPKPFLRRMLEAPDDLSVDNAVKNLQDLGMLSHDEKITTLGRFAATFPQHPTVSRGLLFGSLFGCLRPILIMASHDMHKPLVFTAENSIRDQLRSSVGFSDLADDDRFAFVCAFDEYHEAVQRSDNIELERLHDRYVRRTAYNDMLSVGRQLHSLLANFGLIPYIPYTEETPSHKLDKIFPNIPKEVNTYEKNLPLVRAVALTMMNANLAVWDEGTQAWWTHDTKTFLRPFSVNAKDGLRAANRVVANRREGEVMAHNVMLHTVGNMMPMMVETSNVPPLVAMLFGGSIELIDKTTIEINGWLRYRITSSRSEGDQPGPDDEQAASLIIELRKAIDRVVAQAECDLSEVIRIRRGSDMSEKASLKGRYYQARQFNRLRDVFATELARVLELDDHYWTEHNMLSGDVIERLGERMRRNQK